MALVILSSELSQGTSSPETLAWTASAGVSTTLTGAGLPLIAAGEYFEIRDHTQAENNGLYKETAQTAGTSVTADKISGANPSDQASELVTWLGDSNTLAKNVMFDTAAKELYLLEQGALDVAGVGLDIVYKFAKEEWKDDDYLNAFPFPFFAIDTDAGKYIMGSDGSNANGWVWKDVVSPVIRTRKLIRAAGWSEVNAVNETSAEYAGIVTLGTFQDTTDLAYYQFGTDTTVDDTVDFDFTDAVNEAILCYFSVGQPDTFTFVAGIGSPTGNDSVTRATGSWITDGFKVGGAMDVHESTGSPSNDGIYTILSVTALTMEFAPGSFALPGVDAGANVHVDNRAAFSVRLRVQGKTHGASNLAAAGETSLGNRLFKFPLSNVTDLKVVVADVGIDANSDGAADTAPYTGMSITYFATPQTIAGYVGGSFDFGIELDAASGTAQELYEFVQWSLRSTGGFGSGDIDSDADIAIGRAMDDLLVFEGDTLISGKGIPINPDGGGSGVYITNIAAVDANNVKNFDNTGTQQAFPETVAVTLDFNAALINDTVATYDLYFDRTIRTVTDATFVITAGTGATGTFVSTGQFPATIDGGVNSYVRVSGLLGVDAEMNGVYQVTALTSTSLWSVRRWDNTTIVTTSAAIGNIDQHAIDTPNAIIVNSDVPAPVSGLASADFSFSFDFDGNVQGGRVVSTETFVVARALGISSAQYIQSSVQSIQTGTPLTIVLTASNELNVAA